MTFQQLTFVVEVARCSSINKAAERLYTHQSNVSNVVKQLESELDIKIFSRTQKGVQLTDEGKEFLIYAEELLAKKEFVENIYTVRNRNKPFYFTISSMRSFTAFEPFIDIYNSGKIDLTAPLYLRFKKCSFKSVLDDVSGGDSDIGIVFTLKSQKRKLSQITNIKNISCFELGESHINVVLRDKHPILQRKKISELSKYPYIIIEGNENFGIMYEEESETISKLFANTPQCIISTNDSMTCQNIVDSTDAFFISTTPWLHGKNYNFASIPLEGDENTLVFYYVVRRDSELPPFARDFIESLKKMFAGI